MTIHRLKIQPKYYEVVASGVKTFEVRKNDRDYKLLDTLYLREWEATTRIVEAEDGNLVRVASDEYTGREVHRTVTYILQGGQWGIEEGYVVLGMVPCD